MAIFPGLDASGNGNDWTTNNINNTDSTATTYDIMTDVPTLTDEDTANYAVLNSLVSSTGTFSNGNLDVSTTTVNAASTTMFQSTGKLYWEVVNTSGTAANTRFGFVNTSGVGVNLGSTTNTWAYLGDARVYYNGSTSSYGVSYATNDIIMIALDLDAGKVWYGKNGTWMASGNPATGANPSQTFTANQLMCPAVASGTGTIVYSLNFGQRPFAYTPPAGYLKLNTFNLPDSSIVDGSEYMNPVLYTGNGGTKVVTTGFQPDLVWMKNRGAAQDNTLMDSVRAGDGILISNWDGAETFPGDIAIAYNSDDFTLTGANARTNTNLNTYVAWNWKAGGTAVSNTAGTITSQVSANTTSGFSIVTYTGNGTAGATIGHGLGANPAMIIVKGRTNTDNWAVYRGDLGGTERLLLNTTSSVNSDVAYWNNTDATSSVFTVHANAVNNGSSQDYVAYCWSEVEGYSKFGSYTGNGSADGTFVYTGFRPAFVMVKRTNSSLWGWVIIDNKRSTASGNNLIDNSLLANASNSEYAPGSGWVADFLSNGFKFRMSANHSSANGNGDPYIYMAFAENPFKNSLAR
jgi:hypothetical protein